MTRAPRGRWRGAFLPSLALLAVLASACLAAGLASVAAPTTITSPVCTNTNRQLPSVSVLRICAYLTSPKEMLEEVGTTDGEVVLHSPFSGVDVTHGAPGCGLAEGHPCVVQHSNWIGSIFDTAGCGQHTPTCTVQLPTGFDGWTIVRVELNDNDEHNEVAFVVSGPAQSSCRINSTMERGSESAGGSAAIFSRISKQNGVAVRVTCGAAGSTLTGAWSARPECETVGSGWLTVSPYTHERWPVYWVLKTFGPDRVVNHRVDVQVNGETVMTIAIAANLEAETATLFDTTALTKTGLPNRISPSADVTMSCRPVAETMTLAKS